MDCKFPTLTAIWAYRKGCRCERCRIANNKKPRYYKVTVTELPTNKLTSRAFGGC